MNDDNYYSVESTESRELMIKAYRAAYGRIALLKLLYCIAPIVLLILAVFLLQPQSAYNSTIEELKPYVWLPCILAMLNLVKFLFLTEELLLLKIDGVLFTSPLSDADKLAAWRKQN